MKILVQHQGFLHYRTSCPKRFGSFGLEFAWPSQDGVMAKAMYELSAGKQSDKQAVVEWQKKSNDEWVKLWASLYLIRFDKANYNTHLDSLDSVLRRCDGISYYPYAMSFLLRQHEPQKLCEWQKIYSKKITYGIDLIGIMG